MSEVLLVDPVMTDDQLTSVVDVWKAFPTYSIAGAGSLAKRRARRQGGEGPGHSSVGDVGDVPAAPSRPRFAPGLATRVDAGRNFARQGGWLGDHQDPLLTKRNMYFREIFLEGSQVYAPGIEGFLANQPLADAAERLYGLGVVCPWNVYANLMLPGQELGVHVDVPEFRGARRGSLPSWLLCAMHHSGLFERWRIKIATGVTYVVGRAEVGAFLCFPDGPDGALVRLPATPNTALMLDSDSLFHGVERIPGDDAPLAHLDVNSRLVHTPKGRWVLRCGPKGALEKVATYDSDELRLSVSWKAYCFADQAERDALTSPHGALTPEVIVATLVAALVDRGRLEAADHGLSEEELGLLVIDEFLPFPDLGLHREALTRPPASAYG